MAVWHVACTVPELLDNFQRVGPISRRPNLGDTVIFAMAFIYFVLGALPVRNVRGAR